MRTFIVAVPVLLCGSAVSGSALCATTSVSGVCAGEATPEPTATTSAAPAQSVTIFRHLTSPIAHLPLNFAAPTNTAPDRRNRLRTKNNTLAGARVNDRGRDIYNCPSPRYRRCDAPAAGGTVRPGPTVSAVARQPHAVPHGRRAALARRARTVLVPHPHPRGPRIRTRGSGAGGAGTAVRPRPAGGRVVSGIGVAVRSRGAAVRPHRAPSTGHRAPR